MPRSAKAAISSVVAIGSCDEWLGDIHVAPLDIGDGGDVPLTSTRASRFSLNCPSVTTRSPSLRPEVTTVRSPVVGPTLIGRGSAVSFGVTIHANKPCRTPLHRGRWNNENIAERLEQQARVDEFARPQPFVIIGEDGLQTHGVGSGIDCIVDKEELSCAQCSRLFWSKAVTYDGTMG